MYQRPKIIKQVMNDNPDLPAELFICPECHHWYHDLDPLFPYHMENNYCKWCDDYFSIPEKDRIRHALRVQAPKLNHPELPAPCAGIDTHPTYEKKRGPRSKKTKALQRATPMTTSPSSDPVQAPAHYRQHPSGIEAIDITEHLNFCRGNAIKYLWRAGLKGDELEDLQKALWYVQREVDRVTRIRQEAPSC